MNLREAHQIELARLKSTDHLKTQLPMHRTFALEKKEDGQRYSLQLGPSGKFLVSRSRHDKTKGVEVSKSQPFIVESLLPWMTGLEIDVDVILDLELCALGCSTSSEVSKSSTEKKIVVFDCLWMDGDTRGLTNQQRFELASGIVELLDHERVQLVEREILPQFAEPQLEFIFEKIKRTGREGYVLKSVDAEYAKNGYGWKIKLKDNCDGFVVAVSEEKKHNLGKVVKTGRVGSVAVAWWLTGVDRVNTHHVVAWVALPEEMRCPLDQKLTLMNRVVEFSHLGWSGKLFRFPQFIQERHDKGAIECTWDMSKTKVEISE